MALNVAVAHDALACVLRVASAKERAIVEMRLADYNISEIASTVGLHERTVRKALQKIAKKLARLLKAP